jgi:DNA mismatch repair ATPase MutS
MTDAWNFAQVDAFWLRYQPLTPWGRDAYQARVVLVDKASIALRHDDIESALFWLEGRSADPVALDRMAYHLKRMPRLPLSEKDEYEILELFQIKKFLANFRGLLSLLDSRECHRFGLAPVATALAAELDRGGSDSETFYLADSYDPELGPLRARLAEVDASLRSQRTESERRAKTDHGLIFDGRDFVVFNRTQAEPLLAQPGRYALEPYDDTSWLVRLIPGAEALALSDTRERLLQQEQEAENRVLIRLSALVRQALPELRLAVQALLRWDLARAGAVLAQAHGLVRPELDSPVLELAGARLVPCEDECKELGLGYTPLDARFTASAVVLFGSNMGGKTVVLKTVLFFQLLAQAGLFVPARRFASRVYQHIEYIGALAGERLAGLSGFGFEVWRFAKASRESGDALIAFDELARTTGSHEAEALLSAIVEQYAGAGPTTRAFFATHFRGIVRTPDAEYRKMRGLDREAAGKDLDASDATLNVPRENLGRDTPLAERLASINRHMRYEVVDDDPAAPAESDALAIAGMLGLDQALVKRAEYFFHKDGS